MTTKYLTFLTLIFVSCCGIHTEVEYVYDDITITRIDECGKTTFYYEKGQEKSKSKLWVTYSGINDGFSGYLKFNKSGKVLLLSGDGYFQSEQLDSSKFEYKRIAAYERPEIGESVCAIQLSTRNEKMKMTRRNQGSKRRIKSMTTNGGNGLEMKTAYNNMYAPFKF